MAGQAQAKVREMREAEAYDLCAIVEEHRRDDTDATMLALAETVRELRANLTNLRSAIDSALGGRGRIGFWLPYGPHWKQSRDQTIDLARKQMADPP
jgi:hypothetical protein